MTPEHLGDDLARLVWENVSDYLDRGPLPIPEEIHDGAPTPGASIEELLILFLWVHTRACQQALGARVGADRLKATLDAMHRAVFEDLEAHGVRREAMPLFEQRVSARYTEYYAAAGAGTDRVCDVAARRICGGEPPDPRIAASLAAAAINAADPLRDYLEDVDLDP